MNELFKRIITSFLLVIILYLSFNNKYILFISLFLIFYISLTELKNICFKIFKNNFKKFIFLSLAILFLISFLIISWLLFTKDNQSKNLILFLLCISISTDIGGYVFGKLFKGKKLTTISPNKTYSGMVGSFILATSSPLLFLNILVININIFLFAFIISLVSQIGDLFFSFLKRKAKINDTGNILPGHGGLLDRVDGLIFAIPIGYILTELIK